MTVRYLAAFLSAFSASGSAAPIEPIDPRVEEVLARSRATSSTYTIFWRLRGSLPGGEPSYDWVATFRRGNQLRHEEGDKRVVADCNAGTALLFREAIGRYNYERGPKIAKRFCGISADRKIRSAEYLGRRPSAMGMLDQIRLSDEDGIFTYDVAPGGEVVGIEVNYIGTKYIVVWEIMKMVQSVPSEDIFSRVSLATSQVPKAIKAEASRAPR